GVAWWFPSDPRGPGDRVRALATLHTPTLAVVDRHAHVPTVYATPGLQPLAYIGGKPREHRFRASDSTPNPDDYVRQFEVVWACGAPDPFTGGLAAAGARSIANVGRCALWRSAE